MYSGLRLTVISESYKHDLEAFYRAKAPTEACPKSNLLCGLQLKLSHRMIFNVLRLEAVF